MKLPNKPKVLAATYNSVSKTKMISFLVDFPTVLLAELRTHRILTQGSLYEHSELVDLSLSANSARAIPDYRRKVADNIFLPIWTKKQKGMSGELIIDTENLNDEWDKAFCNAEQSWYNLNSYEGHKQNINRVLSPFAYTTCILSGTEWDNFFELRCPKYYYEPENIYFKSKKEYTNKFNSCFDDNLDDTTVDWQSINHSSAQPEFQVIAEMLYDLYQEADWKESKYHIPFLEDIRKRWDDHTVHLHAVNEDDCYFDVAMKISASMCAKLSYNTQDNEDTLEKHLERANMLIESKHSEPFSHQAIAMGGDEYKLFFKQTLSKTPQLGKEVEGQDNNNNYILREYGWCYNLKGFISQRYILENY